MSTIVPALALQGCPPVPVVENMMRRAQLSVLDLLKCLPEFSLVAEDDPGRSEVEAFVAACFAASYDASLHHFMPSLLTMSCLGKVSAAVGIRPAMGSDLFLERYLSCAIEEAIADAALCPVDRASVVEIGNLVASRRGASHLIFVVLATALWQAGYVWMSFSATRALRNNLRHLGYATTVLAQADPGCLSGHEQKQWGSYYSTEPLVLAGNLADAMVVSRNNPALRRIMAQYGPVIDTLARTLRGEVVT